MAAKGSPAASDAASEGAGSPEGVSVDASTSQVSRSKTKAGHDTST